MTPADFHTSHFLVPKHEILAKSKHEEILTSLGVDAQKLPKIKLQDPQVKFLGAKDGDIVKITRKDPTKENIYYRLVVK
ncbi:DNA-directed RNA polymerase subunit H [Candidatus Micrarchaeota archaeon]|nr:DNA-directed RNA polymerase subunit H [Candidatus Micrarchaeota archaeon]